MASEHSLTSDRPQACEPHRISSSTWTSRLSSLVRPVACLLLLRADLVPSKDSIKVYTSTNNVLLTSGIDGVVPPRYFKKVVHKVKGGELEELPLDS